MLWRAALLVQQLQQVACLLTTPRRQWLLPSPTSSKVSNPPAHAHFSNRWAATSQTTDPLSCHANTLTSPLQKINLPGGFGAVCAEQQNFENKLFSCSILWGNHIIVCEFPSRVRCAKYLWVHVCGLQSLFLWWHCRSPPPQPGALDRQKPNSHQLSSPAETPQAWSLQQSSAVMCHGQVSLREESWTLICSL